MARHADGGGESTSSPPHAAIDVAGLCFRYPWQHTSTRRWTVEALSFQVAEGEILGLVGPNGSGKSSLIKLLAGLLSPNAGTIALGGRPLRSLSRLDVARMVAVVPQDYVQVFPFTVAETVLMGRHPHRTSSLWNLGLSDASLEDQARAARAMADTDVWSLAHRQVSELSGGERQRAVIARALAQGPRILFLDEPTAFLDINHQIEICSLIARLRLERRLSVIMASHDLNVASQYCDRILMLREGRLFRIGPPGETIQPEIIRALYGCEVVVDPHPQTHRPRVTMPGLR